MFAEIDAVTAGADRRARAGAPQRISDLPGSAMAKAAIPPSINVMLEKAWRSARRSDPFWEA